MKNLTDASAFADVPVPEDAVDRRTAASLESSFQSLANRTRYLLQRLAGTVIGTITGIGSGATNAPGLVGIGKAGEDGDGVEGTATGDASGGYFVAPGNGVGAFGQSQGTGPGVMGQATGSGHAVHGQVGGAIGGSGSGYAVYAEGDPSTPTKASFRLGLQAAAPSSPDEGAVYYNSVTHKLYCYDGSTWQACW